MGALTGGRWELPLHRSEGQSFEARSHCSMTLDKWPPDAQEGSGLGVAHEERDYLASLLTSRPTAPSGIRAERRNPARISLAGRVRPPSQPRRTHAALSGGTCGAVRPCAPAARGGRALACRGDGGGGAARRREGAGGGLAAGGRRQQQWLSGRLTEDCVPSGRRTEQKHVAGQVDSCEPTVDREAGRAWMRRSQMRRPGGSIWGSMYLPLEASGDIATPGAPRATATAAALRGDARRAAGGGCARRNGILGSGLLESDDSGAQSLAAWRGETRLSGR